MLCLAAPGRFSPGRLEEKKKAREQRKAQEDANTAVTMEIPSEGQAQGEPEEPEVPKNDASHRE